VLPAPGTIPRITSTALALYLGTGQKTGWLVRERIYSLMEDACGSSLSKSAGLAGQFTYTFSRNINNTIGNTYTFILNGIFGSRTFGLRCTVPFPVSFYTRQFWNELWFFELHPYYTAIPSLAPLR